uniref:Sodium-coupled monocarboxylate transporter 2 n=1 Tax=Strongyloides venezuelensis TaxID=75913 RepID=A0A0K0FXU9_STRVS
MVSALIGPKLSAFLIFMSGAGVAFLGVLGVFFYSKAVTLFPDLHFPEHNVDPTYSEIEIKYYEKATQCWIATAMYAVTFIIVLWQNRYNTVSIF